MTKHEATKTAKEWQKHTLCAQPFETYIEGLRKRYMSYTGKEINSDVVSVVTAVSNLKQDRGFIHETHNVEN
jgi:hypothetical protein